MHKTISLYVLDKCKFSPVMMLRELSTFTFNKYSNKIFSKTSFIKSLSHLDKRNVYLMIQVKGLFGFKFDL